MEVILAENYGFCFGVKRAIKIAQENKNSSTLGPLIHNQLEIARLKNDYKVDLYESIDEVKQNDTVIIRTHGIPKNDLATLKEKDANIVNATCPFVTTPQQIVKEMSKQDYSIVLFGDKNHPEVKGVKSYGDDVHVVLEESEIDSLNFKFDKIATVAQTTRQKENYLKIINKLLLNYKEVRVFNTICDATFENQDAVEKLSKTVDVMIIIGGKNSSNTKQLLHIAENYCAKSYLIEDETELEQSWFEGAKKTGVSAGASTPDWIIQNVVEKLKEYSS